MSLFTSLWEEKTKKEMLLCTNIGVICFEMHLYGKVLLIKYLQAYSQALIAMSKYNGAVEQENEQIKETGRDQD